ncbi:hypothetical protein V2J09_007069 [Rumex salicifolius]
MGRKAAFAAILLFLIVADVANAATPFLWNFRKLVSSAPKEKPYEIISPNPSPAPMSGDGSSKDKQLNKTPPPAPAKNDKEVEKKKDETKANEPSWSNDKCDLGKRYCKDKFAMTACVQAVDKARKVKVILIQNDGDSNIKVNIRTSSLNELKDGIEVPEHHSQKTNISLSDAGSLIILNAGNGDCNLQLGAPASKHDFSEWIPSYSELMTPIYGAYFLILITIIALSVFACCKFKNRRQDEIPYQELEMGETQVATSADVEAADCGWDQGWDDDWDDDKAVKSPRGQHPDNGHTKPTNPSDWEDWDD